MFVILYVAVGVCESSGEHFDVGFDLLEIALFGTAGDELIGEENGFSQRIEFVFHVFEPNFKAIKTTLEAIKAALEPVESSLKALHCA